MGNHGMDLPSHEASAVAGLWRDVSARQARTDTDRLESRAGLAVDGAHAGEPVGEAIEGVGFTGFLLEHIGAELHGLLLVARQARGGKDSDPGTRLQVAHPFEDFESASARHFQVEHHDVRKGMFGAVGVFALPTEVSDGDFAILGSAHQNYFGIALQRAFKQKHVVFGIFD